MRFDALLFNCSQPEVMADAIKAGRAELDAFTTQHGAAPPMIGVYGNAFPQMDKNYEGANANIHQLREDITPENYLHFARHWAEIGADIIGGCCGVSPDHISLLAKALKDPPPLSAPEFG
jgi:homocysteine S-methyltransferase